MFFPEKTHSPIRHRPPQGDREPRSRRPRNAGFFEQRQRVHRRSRSKVTVNTQTRTATAKAQQTLNFSDLPGRMGPPRGGPASRIQPLSFPPEPQVDLPQAGDRGPRQVQGFHLEQPAAQAVVDAHGIHAACRRPHRLGNERQPSGNHFRLPLRRPTTPTARVPKPARGTRRTSPWT